MSNIDLRASMEYVAKKVKVNQLYSLSPAPPRTSSNPNARTRKRNVTHQATSKSTTKTRVTISKASEQFPRQQHFLRPHARSQIALMGPVLRFTLLQVLALVSLTLSLLPAVPSSSASMVSDAARCVREANLAGLRRQSVKIVVPPVNVDPADLDPWPGGIRQVSREAKPYIEKMLKAIVGVGGADCVISTTTLESESGVVQYVAQGETAADDVCVLAFADVEQIKAVRALDEACGKDRLFILVNPQFSSVRDFSFFAKGKAKEYLGEGTLSDLFPCSYCLEEQAVRSEDVKLVYNWGLGWGTFASVGNSYSGMNLVEAGDNIELHNEALSDRPTYQNIEAWLNEKLPDPVFIRKLKEAAAGKNGPFSR